MLHSRDNDAIQRVLDAQRSLMEGGNESPGLPDRRLSKSAIDARMAIRRKDADRRLSKMLHHDSKLGRDIVHRINAKTGPRAKSLMKQWGRGVANPALEKAQRVPRSRLKAKIAKSQAKPERSLRRAPKAPKVVSAPKRMMHIPPAKDMQGTPEQKAAFAQRAKAWDRDKMNTQKSVSAPYKGRYGGPTYFNKSAPASPVGVTGKSQPAFRRGGAALLRKAGVGGAASGVAMPHSKGRQIRDASREAENPIRGEPRRVFAASVDLSRTPLLNEQRRG